jgi:predicted transcriptional regulator
MKNREGIAMKPRELVEALRAMGLTQKQIEARTGIPQPTVSKIGLGRVRDVMSRHYLALLKVYEQEMSGQVVQPARVYTPRKRSYD